MVSGGTKTHSSDRPFEQRGTNPPPAGREKGADGGKSEAGGHAAAEGAGDRAARPHRRVVARHRQLQHVAQRAIEDASRTHTADGPRTASSPPAPAHAQGFHDNAPGYPKVDCGDMECPQPYVPGIAGPPTGAAPGPRGSTGNSAPSFGRCPVAKPWPNGDAWQSELMEHKLSAFDEAAAGWCAPPRPSHRPSSSSIRRPHRFSHPLSLPPSSGSIGTSGSSSSRDGRGSRGSRAAGCRPTSRRCRRARSPSAPPTRAATRTRRRRAPTCRGTMRCRRRRGRRRSSSSSSSAPRR